jgi:hypothetical protein
LDYKDLARENLSTAEGAYEAGCFNAAASRFYYAMFHAALYRYKSRAQVAADELAGMRAQGRWDHRQVALKGAAVRGIAADRNFLLTMRALRNDADYEEVGVDPAKLHGRLNAIKKFMEDALA